MDFLQRFASARYLRNTPQHKSAALVGAEITFLSVILGVCISEDLEVWELSVQGRSIMLFK